MCRAGGLLLNSPEEGDEELHQVHDAVVLRESDLEEDRRGERRIRRVVNLISASD